MTTTFFYTLAGGTLVVLTTAPADQLAWRFLRNATLLAAGLLAGVTAWQVVDGPRPLAPAIWLGGGGGILALSASLLAPVAQRHPHGWRGLALVAAAPVLLAALSSTRELNGPPSGDGWLAVASAMSQLTAAALLGSITVAWLLGHAYLTATRMTIAPLRHFTRLVSWSVAARFLSLAGIILMGYVCSGGSLLTDLTMAWLIVLLRVGVGLAAVAVFAYMVSDCVRLRSTQSATGILYFGSVFAYVGEFCALDFLADYGWPL